MKKIITLSFLLAFGVCSFAQEAQQIEISTDTSFLHIKVFPNPARQCALLTFSNPKSIPHHLYLVTVSGQVIRTYGDIRQNHIMIPLTDLKPGLYFFELRGKLSRYGRLMVE